MPRACDRVASSAAAALWVCCLAFGARAADFSSHGTGLPAALGPGAAALVDPAAGAFGNPALLPAASRHEGRLDLGVDASGSPWQRVGWTLPTLRNDALAFGFVRADVRGQDVSRREAFLFSYGRPVRPGMRFGATLELRAEHPGAARGRSFGVDVGTSASCRGFELGAVLRHAVRPLRDGDFEPLAVEAGIARSASLGADWRASGTLGWEAQQAAPGAAWLGARFAWKERFELAASGTNGTARGGVGIRCWNTHLEYTFESGSELRHALGIRMLLGRSVSERRAEAAQRADSLLASRVAHEISERQAREVASRLGKAQQALDGGAHDRAAELFREILLWSPEHPEASAGLRRAQLAAMLAQSDTATAREDWASATTQLENALRLFPGDSLAAAKLEDVRAAQVRADRTRSEAAAEVRLGLDAYATQRYLVAASRFEAALRLDPANETAGEFLQLSRAAHEARVRTLVAQARKRLERGDPDGARSVLGPVFASAADHPEVREVAAGIDRELERQAREQRLAEARRRAEEMHEDLTPPPLSTTQLAATYEEGMQMYRAGNLASAMTAWEEVARTAPHFEEVDRYLLRVYRVVGLESYTEGRLREAIEVWSKALRLEPDNAQVRRYLDQANAKLQRAQELGGAR